jgi:hypothetical protein
LHKKRISLIQMHSFLETFGNSVPCAITYTFNHRKGSSQ